VGTLGMQKGVGRGRDAVPVSTEEGGIVGEEGSNGWGPSVGQ
jgi:hypothetical protein